MTAGACVRVAKTAIPAPPAILSIILGIFMCQSASAQAAAAWPRKIVAFGDSTTAPRGNLKVYADILRDELTGVQVINAGVGGNTTSMARLRFEADVLTHAPDLVLIQFGINDSAIDVSRGAAQPRVSRETYAAAWAFVFYARARALNASAHAGSVAQVCASGQARTTVIISTGRRSSGMLAHAVMCRWRYFGGV